MLRPVVVAVTAAAAVLCVAAMAFAVFVLCTSPMGQAAAAAITALATALVALCGAWILQRRARRPQSEAVDQLIDFAQRRPAAAAAATLAAFLALSRHSGLRSALAAMLVARAGAQGRH